MSVTTTAVVTVTLTIRAAQSSWDDKCHVGQAYREARSAALNRLGAAIGSDKNITFVSVDSVAIMSEVTEK